MANQQITLKLKRNPDSILESNQNFHNGANFSLYGSGFGTRAGYSDHPLTNGLYALAVGSNFGVVNKNDGSDYQSVSNRPVISNEGINGKCLKWSQSAGGNPNNAYVHTFPRVLNLGEKLFISYYIKHSAPASTIGGQIKYLRVMKGNSVVDKANEFYVNMHNGTPDNKIQLRDYRGVGASPGDFTMFGPTDVSRMPNNKNKWFRMDILATMNDAYANPDSCKLETWVHDPDGALVPLYTLFTSNQAVQHIAALLQAGDEYQRILFQIYCGTGGASSDFGSVAHTVWMDKMFISFGDQKRLEIANNSNYDLATVRYVIPDYAWTDTKIDGVGDKGILSTGWLFYIDNSGNKFYKGYVNSDGSVTA